MFLCLAAGLGTCYILCLWLFFGVPLSKNAISLGGACIMNPKCKQLRQATKDRQHVLLMVCRDAGSSIPHARLRSILSCFSYFQQLMLTLNLNVPSFSGSSAPRCSCSFGWKKRRRGETKGPASGALTSAMEGRCLSPCYLPKFYEGSAVGFKLLRNKCIGIK